MGSDRTDTMVVPPARRIGLPIPLGLVDTRVSTRAVITVSSQDTAQTIDIHTAVVRVADLMADGLPCDRRCLNSIFVG